MDCASLLAGFRPYKTDAEMMNAQDAWRIAHSQLEIQLDRGNFETWLRAATFLGYEDEVFTIGVPSSMARDMLQHRLYKDVRRVLGDVCGAKVEVRFEVHKPVREDDGPEELPLFRLMTQPSVVQETATPSEPLHRQVARPQRPELPEAELNPRFRFDRFIANQANRLTLEASLSVAEYPAARYNPFFIYGGVGLGKTHLLQAIAHACQERGLRVIYIPSEAFVNDLVDAIRQRTTAMFRDRYRSVDVLCVDDIQFIAGKESTQEEFFHTFNHLTSYNKQIVLASDRHPTQLATLEDRLRSRFAGGLVMDLQPPEYETRVAILQMWAHERGIPLEPSVAERIAERASLNTRELEGAFNQMVATAQISRQPLNADMADGVLNSFRAPRPHLRSRITIEQVLAVAADYHHIHVEDLVGPRRTARLNQARQIAMYLAREIGMCSLVQIGDAFGGRSHSTVLHSCNKVETDLPYDEFLRRDVEAIQRELLGR